jgi:hypothetical protein
MWFILFADTFLHFPECNISHVKGHQEKEIRYQDLSLWAQLNVDANHLAGNFQQVMQLSPTMTRMLIDLLVK